MTFEKSYEASEALTKRVLGAEISREGISSSKTNAQYFTYFFYFFK